MSMKLEKIVLISCVSKKLNHKAKAKNIYDSPLFKYCMKYAKSLSPDKIFILSAKYGLLKINQEISPYNETLNTMPSSRIKEWAEKVVSDMRNETDLENDEFIFLAGEKYRRYLLPHLRNYKIPMEGLSIGRQLSYLKRKVAK